MTTKGKIITAISSLVLVVVVGIIAVTALISGVAQATFKITYSASQVNCQVDAMLQVYNAKGQEKATLKQTAETARFDHESVNEPKDLSFDSVNLECDNDGADYIIMTFTIANTISETAQTDIKGIEALLEINKNVSDYMTIEVTASVTKKDSSTETADVLKNTTNTETNLYDIEYKLGVGEILTIQVKLSITDISKDFELEGTYKLTLEGTQLV